MAEDVVELRLTEEQRQFIRRASSDAFPGRAEPPACEAGEAAIARLYTAVGLSRPCFFYADNPVELMQIAFLLQSLASVPHGSKRRELRRSRISLPSADLGWRLVSKLQGRWQQALMKLMAQLDAATLEKLGDDSHRACTQVSYYYQPDVLTTCGSRLGFPTAPALASLYQEVIRDARGRVWECYSRTVAHEFVALAREHTDRPLWRQRPAIEMAIFGADALSVEEMLSDVGQLRSSRLSEQMRQQIMEQIMALRGGPIIGVVKDLEADARSSPLPGKLRRELTNQLQDDLFFEFMSLQDTRCYHERTDGTSALKPASHIAQTARHPTQQTLDACSNPIYLLNWGSWLLDELCIWKAAENMHGPGLYNHRLTDLLNDFLLLKSSGFAYIFGSRAVFVCPNPVRTHFGDREDLHHWDEPAVQFADGSNFHFWRGIFVSKERREQFKKLNVKLIEQERNIEIRRVLIERYGTSRYLEETGAVLISKDSCGVLYRKELAGDEPLVMVRVKNSTKEPDGTWKHYYLRVPPHIRSAKEAVAWTFDIQPQDYRPEKQT
jgi:hypothetical protein